MITDSLVGDSVTVLNDIFLTGLAAPSPVHAPASVGVLARTGIFSTPELPNV